MAVQISGVAAAARTALTAVAALLILLSSVLGGAARAQSPVVGQNNNPPPLPATTPTNTNGPPAMTTPSSGAPTVAKLPGASNAAGAMAPKKPGPNDPPSDKLDATWDRGHDYDPKTQIETLIGNVKLVYNGYTVTCDRVTINHRTEIVTFDNNVTLANDSETVYADRIQLNRLDQTFTSTEARTVIPPQFLSSSLLEPLRLSGKTISRVGKNLIATDGMLTTCDFPNPHYKIGFAQAQIIPNDRIILRKAVLYRYDRPELRIEYLSLPIRDDISYSYAPVVGHNDVEGYFIKNAIGYTLAKNFPGILRVDYMTNKGLGLGFDQAYKFGAFSAGTLVLYEVHDKTLGTNDFDGKLNHQQRIGDTVTGITSDFESNSYDAVTPSSKTANTTINTTRTVGGNTTTANLTFGNSASSGSSSTSNSYSLSQTDKIGQTGSFSAKLSGSDSSTSYAYTAADGTATTTSSGTKQQELDLSDTGRIGFFAYTVSANKELIYELTGSSSTNGSVYSGPEKLPDVLLTTDSTSLKDLLLPGLFSAVPIKFSFGYGRYSNETSVTEEIDDAETTIEKRITQSRSLFETSISPKPIPLTSSGRLTLQTDGDFKQTAYSGDYDQYVLKQDDTLTQTLATNSSVNLVYGYLRPYGGAPPAFLGDQPGSVNNLGTNLTITGSRIKLVLGTGYDLQEARQAQQEHITAAPWQTVSSQLAFKPDDVLQSRFTTSYDINTGRLISANNTTSIKGKEDFSLNTSTDYDPISHHISQISEVLQTPVFSRDLRLSVLTGYNGLTHKFSYKNFGIVRSFHDYEIVFNYLDQPYGYTTNKGFNITIRLKAFPSASQSATGQFGTSLSGTGTGDVF